MTMKEQIFFLFEKHYTGKDNAVKRMTLIKEINYPGMKMWYGQPYVTDREMRQAYEDLPICGSSKGLYLPETQQEINEQIALHIKKIRSYVRKIKVLKQYKIESDPIQKDLFYGGINDQH